MVGLKDAAKRINEIYETAIVGDISKNWRAVEAADLRGHREFIKKNSSRPGFLETEGEKKRLKG
jgi:hypothetical protein